MSEPAGPLAPYRVLDLTDHRGSLCGKILADLGADVVKVEPPEGSPARRVGPFTQDREDPERSLYWWAYAANCRSLVLDLATPDSRARLLELARAADFLLESFPPGHLERLGLGWATLHETHPRLIVTSIMPFGADGPYRDFEGPDLVLQAMGGMMHQLGDPDRPPVRIGVPQAFLQAAGQAAVGTLVAHTWRERTGVGQRVEVTGQVAMMWTMMSETGFPVLHGYDPFRDGVATRYAGLRRRVIFPCRDGFVVLVVAGGAIGGRMLEALTAWMVEEAMAPEFMRGRDWKSWDATYLLAKGAQGQAEIDLVTDAVGAFVAAKTKAELYEGALTRGILLAPVADTADLLQDPQLAARQFFIPLLEPRLGREVVHPGPFARLSATPIRLSRPAPAIGEHSEEVLREWRAGRASPASSAALDSAEAILPFQGLRVIDFAWLAATPITGRLLAEFGADVIRVESALRIDPGRTLPPWAEGKSGPDRSQLFANYNACKRSVALNLSFPRARELARQLIARADIVIESFTPGTMARWGLDYESVRAVKPDLIYLSSCQQGQTGPHSRYAGYGSLAAALAGFNAVTGWQDRDPPSIYGAYTDFVAPHFASSALLAALDHRRRTGQGQHIDLSQLEASLHFLAPEILDYTVNGRVARRRGNADDRIAPHGAYPCAGEDRWCAIVCESEAQWQALCRAMGKPDWCRRPQFATAASRKRHEAELDRLIGEWTATQEAYALMDRLQRAGVPAGVVQSCADLHQDSQLKARGAFVWLEHPEMGRSPYEAWAFRCAASPGRLGRAPCLGEHTEEVLTEILGMTTAELRQLKEQGVFQ
ncbi:MAG: CoA transferase [Candidatus Rokubacteria bacterium]|nr:CoA transferase [Candidatus Rokubacteria bacterium]